MPHFPFTGCPSLPAGPRRSTGNLHKSASLPLSGQNPPEKCTICHFLLHVIMSTSGEYPHFLHSVSNCGQLLCTTVWRMWKTLVFQQLFESGAILPNLRKSCISRCISRCTGSTPHKLSHRSTAGKNPVSRGSWVVFVGKTDRPGRVFLLPRRQFL